MNDQQKTSSILQRVPVILAVTAASYGLQMPPQALRLGTTASAPTASRDGSAPGRTAGAPASLQPGGDARRAA